jgi:uncharacterized membrane protein YoaK (UPF0700 family)
VLLNALSVSSGAVDAVSFVDLGKVFSAFMTGNIAFLGLQVAGAPGAVAILSSTAAFALGVLLSMAIVKPSQGTGTWPQRVTIALAVSLIPHAVLLSVTSRERVVESLSAARESHAHPSSEFR